MNCNQFEHLLNRYLDSELSGTLKLEFEAHMVDCESCGHLYAMSEAIGQIIAEPASDEPALSSDFSERVMAELEKRNQRKNVLRKILVPSGLVASIAIILVSIIMFSMPDGNMSKRFASARIGVSGVKSPFVLSLGHKADTHSDKVSNLAKKINSDDVKFELGLNMGDEVASMIGNKQNILHDKAREKTLALKSMERDNMEVEKELNSWLNQTLERAGQTVWELAQLKSFAWDKMREELISSLSPPTLMPAGSVMPSMSPVIDNSADIDTSSDNNINVEQGLELI